MKKVLIVSDDAHTRAWVAHALDKLDVLVQETTAATFSTLLAEGEFDLAVVDGGRDPEPLVQALERAAGAGVEASLLLLVELEALASLRMPARVAADFAVRGASSGEIVARVRALVWPGEEPTGQDLVRTDRLTINLATYQAYIDGTPVDFTYLEYALFSFLVTHPNRAYSREMLLRRVWGTDYYGGSRTVDVHVRRIRAKIGAELSKRLETVRNVGYLWVG